MKKIEAIIRKTKFEDVKDALLEALKKYEGAILLVSHEKQFAEAVCNQVFTCKEG